LGGKDGVIVLINGKRSRMPISAVYQMLEGINAGDIEKIEIMTIPPANYDADGDAGFINIVMKKDSDAGTNGNIMVNAGYGTGPRLGGSVNLSHRSKGISIYASYSVNYVDQLQTFDTFRESTSGSEGITSSTFTDRDPYRIAHNFQAGIDYSLGKNTVLGVLISGYNNLWDMESEAKSEFNYAVSADTLVDMTMTEKNHWRHFMGNINLQHSFTGGQMIIANFDYLIYDNSNPTHYLYNYYDSQGNLLKNIENRVSKETPINMTVAKLDYVLPLGSSTTIDAGIKGTFTDLTNNVAFEENVSDKWIADTLLSNYSNLIENVLAGYLALSIKFDDKTTMNAGLRYENTKTELTSVEGESIVDRNYGDFFPTLYLSRELNDNNKLQFSYGRRITRPTFNEMAPFVIFVDPYTFFAGNTNILPTYTNSIKTDYSYKSFIFSLQYSHDKNVIFRFQPKYDPENNILIIQTDNVDRRETFAGTITLPIYVNDWWTMQNNFSGNWQMIETATTSGRYARSQNAFTINSTQTFKLPKEFTLELTGFYQSPTIFGYMNFLSMWFVNLGLQKDFNNNGTFRISVNDIFQSRKIRFETVNNPEVISKAVLQFDKTVFTISYTQKLGNDKLKTRKHSGGSAEEQQRVTN
jgi:outer membrane receptor protein involved in Fe transport